MRAAACLRPAIRLLSSSHGPASASPTRHLRRLLHQFPGASFRSPSASSGSWHWQQTASSLITRFSPLHVPARSYGSVSGRNLPAATTKRHLYVVLAAGHQNLFEIHKLDMDEDGDGDSSGSTGTLLQRLPEPPAVRVEIARGMHFAALDSSIVATGFYLRGTPPSTSYEGVTVVYDTRTAELATSNLLPRGIRNNGACDRAVAIGNTLRPALLRAGEDDAAKEDERWKWRPLPNSPRFSWSWNDTPPELPFDAQSISSYAVHPRGSRGRTLFVSAGGWRVDVGTFTYGTGSGKWKRRGDWELPFRGQGHYDGDLDAWVGLHRVKPEDETLEDLTWETIKTTDGHLCACRVTSAASSSRQPPEWKVSKETLFRQDPPGWTRLEARLVYMGDRGEYCLAEHLDVNDTTCVLRITMFRAKYGEDGELIVTAHRPARSYEVFGYDDGFDTQAFWM
ncbi:hypothetical protein ACQ4PT_012628 [Festuca glaucescens]